MSLNVRQVPVFAFPNALKFYVGSKTTHTQILTLYSPYDFPVGFKVHCHSNAWDKYTVTDAEGTIAPQSSVDLIVTHKMPLPTNCNVIDRFKIVIMDHQTEQVIGRKYVDSVLLPGQKEHRSYDEDFEFSGSKYGDKGSTRTIENHRAARSLERTTTNNYLISIIIVACAIILFLPSQSEPHQPSNLPDYLHVSHKVQLLAAMLLGVFLCILIRS